MLNLRNYHISSYYKTIFLMKKKTLFAYFFFLQDEPELVFILTMKE